jgi:hypothetical protein
LKKTRFLDFTGRFYKKGEKDEKREMGLGKT